MSLRRVFTLLRFREEGEAVATEVAAAAAVVATEVAAGVAVATANSRIQYNALMTASLPT